MKSTAQQDLSSPISRKKTMTAHESMEILKAFYHEAKKELKKESTTNVTLNAQGGMSQLIFHANGFTLSLIATEN